MLTNSPFSRGSALLRASLERNRRKEIERSPNLGISSDKLSIDSSFDRQLTSILRKHELQTSPTNEPKTKKKKVLFAEPVVSSELEFKATPSSPTCGVQPLPQLTDQSFGSEPIKVPEELNEKRRHPMVHQNSTFDKEFDTNSVDFIESQESRNSDSPLLLTQQLFEDETPVGSGLPTQHQTPSPSDVVSDDNSDTILSNGYRGIADSESSEEPFMCSQPMPESTGMFDEEDSHTQTSVGVQTEPLDAHSDTYDDPVVNIPMRLSKVKEFYNIFAQIVEHYSHSSQSSNS